MKTLQNHQKSVEEEVAKEGFIDGHWINPRAVNNAEGEDDQTSDNEDCSKHNEDVVTGVTPPSIVEHLRRLKKVI